MSASIPKRNQTPQPVPRDGREPTSGEMLAMHQYRLAWARGEYLYLWPWEAQA